MIDFSSKSKLKCLLIAQVDWANLGYELEQSLKSVGVDAICVAQQKHFEFQFEPCAYIYKNINEVKALASKANIIMLLHSINTDTGVEHLYNKEVGACVFHGGSIYRRRAREVNDKFLRLNIKLAIIQTADLLNKDDRMIEEWLLPPINVNNFEPIYEHQYPVKKVLAHYPSTPGPRKGTEDIREVILQLKKDLDVPFEYLTGPVIPYLKNLDRLKKCDIYIECLSPTVGGLLHGEWGMSALEAAAFGKVVVTNFLSSDLYKKEYGDHAIVVANNKQELYNQLKKLLLLPMEELTSLQIKTRKWVEEKHSYKAVGMRLLDIFYKHLTWKGK